MSIVVVSQNCLQSRLSFQGHPAHMSEAPRASARGIRGKAKRSCAEANPAFHPPQLGLLRGTPRSPVAIPPCASARGILAKASDPLAFSSPHGLTCLPFHFVTF